MWRRAEKREIPYLNTSCKYFRVAMIKNTESITNRSPSPTWTCSNLPYLPRKRAVRLCRKYVLFIVLLQVRPKSQQICAAACERYLSVYLDQLQSSYSPILNGFHTLQHPYERPAQEPPVTYPKTRPTDTLAPAYSI